MRLYAGSSSQFIRDATRNRVAESLRDAFFDHYRYHPSTGEVASWRNSLRAVSQVFQAAGLTDHGVILEYQLPLTSRRLDCLVTGRSASSGDNAVIIELKQWERCQAAAGENEVLTWVGGAEREVLHPSSQVGQYKRFLQDGHTAFYGGAAPIGLHACSYLHNYTIADGDPLVDPKFTEIIREAPVFSGDDFDPLCRYLDERLALGGGMDVLRRVEAGAYRPSKKLMEHVAGVIKGSPQFVLLDEQLVVYDKVMALAGAGFDSRTKSVLIVKGGPGTGKSVIALNLMADLLLEGRNVHHATGSQSFTQTLRKIIGARGSIQFKYFNSFARAGRNAVDVLICDEAHRIRQTSANRFTRKTDRSDRPQVEELIRAARVSVFFIDDDQVVRPNEVGSVEHIRSHAEKGKARVVEYQLEAQFRCGGSDGFVNWIENTLGIRRTANVIWGENEDFEFRVLPTPRALEAAVFEKAEAGYSARLTAGFCWPWSKELNPDGTLKEDVEVGEYRRPWNARPEATRLARNIPKATYWAYDPNGLYQIGCVYTIQGFEFDYVGVIFGKDLVYDFDRQDWAADKEQSRDTVVRRSGSQFPDLVKRTYRVLLSRGLRGCYVCFLDKDTERFVRSRMEGPAGRAAPRKVAEPET